jgi:RNA-binding protein
VTVPTSSNPKKQSLMPASRLRKALRAAGHHLAPVVQIGKGGVTPGVRQQLDDALLAHELVKVKVGTESPEDRFETATQLAAGPGLLLAQVLGRTVLVYRKHPEKPRFEAGPKATIKAPARRVPPKTRRSAATTKRAPGKGQPRTR